MKPTIIENIKKGNILHTGHLVNSALRERVMHRLSEEKKRVIAEQFADMDDEEEDGSDPFQYDADDADSDSDDDADSDSDDEEAALTEANYFERQREKKDKQIKRMEAHLAKLESQSKDHPDAPYWKEAIALEKEGLGIEKDADATIKKMVGTHNPEEGKKLNQHLHVEIPKKREELTKKRKEHFEKHAGRFA